MRFMACHWRTFMVQMWERLRKIRVVIDPKDVMGFAGDLKF